VSGAWQEFFPTEEIQTQEGSKRENVRVERARPSEAAEIAAFINRLNEKSPPMSASDIMAFFGEKAFLLFEGG
jgi:hypothetical protein